MRNARVIVGLLVVLVAVAGCWVQPQPRPVAIDLPVPTRAQPSPLTGGSARVTLYFIRDDRLVPVLRPTSATSLAEVLELLSAGPAVTEVAAGIRSAVARGSVRAGPPSPLPGTAMVDVTRDFTAVPEADQLLAVAQIVWTVTERAGTTRVILTREGTPLEVPTDRGLSATAVHRGDFLSVAPEPATSPVPRSG